jgi:hypothetical protein
MHVAGGQVEALGPGRRHDMGRVATEQQAAMAHRLEHERAQGAIDFSMAGPA